MTRPPPAPQVQMSRPPAPPLSPRGPAGQPGRRFATLRTTFALILREMATSYGNSPGGYLWAVFEPVAGVAILSLGFGLIFAAPPIGNSFPLFYATGFLPFMLFNDVANKTATSISFSRPLLAYPVVTFVDALLARFLLTTLTHLMVGYLVFIGIIVIFDARADLDLPVALLAFGMAAALGLGIGTLNCYLMTAFPIWERAWQILTRPLFIISGIFFTYDSMPKFAQEIVWYNPLTHIIGMTRKGFYGAYHADYASPIYVMAIAAACGFLGMLLLWRHHRNLMEN